MIRLIFHADMRLSVDQVARIMTRLEKLPFKVTSHIETNFECRIIIDTDMSNAELINAYMPKAENYILCKGCNSVHFRAAETMTTPFVCPCGKKINN